MSLTKDRNTVKLDNPLNKDKSFTAKAGQTFVKGQMVASILTEGGVCVPAAANITGSVVVGVSLENKTTVSGDKIKVGQGVYCFDNSSAGNAITFADIGKRVFAADDHTLSKTDQSTTYPLAGRLEGIDPVYGPAVLINPTLIPSNSLG